MKTSRRKFVQHAFKASVATTIGAQFLVETANAENTTLINEFKKIASPSALQFSQVALPYAYNALEPSIDAVTMDIHYNKHHAAYVKNVNEAIAQEKIAFENEKDFFANASKLSVKARNNGGGSWNHNFFWQLMKPNGGTPSGKVAEAINGTFGSLDKFKEQFSQAAMSRFGSGWAWLVKDGNQLRIGSTPNQDNPMMDVSDFKGVPLLALDVWEHAYYLKYQNRRAEYIANWWNVINWDEVAKGL